jgi:tetratricopeptide (TPR) repeat protein
VGGGNESGSKTYGDTPIPGSVHLLLKKFREECGPDEMIEWCKAALRHYPQDIQLRSLLGESYMRAGAFERADEEFAGVTSSIDEIVNVYKLRAKNFIKLGKRKDAADTVNLYLSHHPDDEEALEILTQSSSMAQEIPPEPVSPPPDERALDTQAETAVSDLASPTLAEIYFSQGRVSEAVGMYEQVVADNPDDSTSANRLAELRALSERGEPTAPESETPSVRERTETMIAILEQWLSKVSRLHYA